MKKFILLGVGILCLVSLAFARGGIWSKVLTQSPQVILTGEVKSLPQWGDINAKGLKLDTPNKEVVVYGIGPARYWMLEKVSTPKIGDNISLKAYRLNINGKIYFIAKEITNAKGETIVLRDSDTGIPLWINQKAKNSRLNSGCCTRNFSMMYHRYR